MSYNDNRSPGWAWPAPQARAAIPVHGPGSPQLPGWRSTELAAPHIGEQAFTARHYIVTRTASPPEPTVMPGRFFPNTVELGHLRNLKWADFYQQCPMGQRMRFEREALLSLLSNAYFSDSDMELLAKYGRRKRKELRQAFQRGDPVVQPWKLTLPGTSPQKVERRSPRLSTEQVKAETRRLMEKRGRAILGWLFEQGNLFVEAELDGKCVSIPSLWVGEEAEGAGGAKPGSAPRRSGRPQIPESESRLLVHLRDHCVPKWSIPNLADKFLGPDTALEDPNGTIEQRLTRARPKYPRANCPHCASDEYPQPPGDG